MTVSSSPRGEHPGRPGDHFAIAASGGREHTLRWPNAA